MALFSRRKKSADDVVADHTETEESVVDAPEVAETPVSYTHLTLPTKRIV